MGLAGVNKQPSLKWPPLLLPIHSLVHFLTKNKVCSYERHRGQGATDGLKQENQPNHTKP